jgi:hypothetical protein
MYEKLTIQEKQTASIINTGKIGSTVLLFSVVIFLCGVLIKLDVPLAEWDRVSIDAAVKWSRGINSPWHFVHPPLYPFFLTLLFKLFGSGVTIARLGNAFSILLTAFVLSALTSRIYNRNAAIWATTFYLLNPVSIQGITSLDVADTSLLPLLFILTIYYLTLNIVHPRLTHTIVLSIIICLCFWAKVTSSLAFVFALLTAIFISFYFEKGRDDYKAYLLNIAGIISGLSLFVITWISISHLIWGWDTSLAVLLNPWTEISVRIQDSNTSSKLIATAYDTCRIIVWLSPYFLLMWVIETLTNIRNPVKGNEFGIIRSLLLWTTIIYFTVYLLTGGSNWGFPRYHAAILPLFCIFIGVFVSNSLDTLTDKQSIIILICTIIFSIILALISNDPIYFLNLRLKKLILFKNPPVHIFRESLLVFFLHYGLPLIYVSILCILMKIKPKMKKFTIYLFLCSLSTIMALNIQHILASYRTSHQYGAEGKLQLLKKVDNHVKDKDCVLATPEFIYDLKEKDLPYINWDVWKSRGRFYQFIEANHPEAIITGLTVNTYSQLKWLLGNDTEKFLTQNYQFIPIGTYYVWFRISKNEISSVDSYY